MTNYSERRQERHDAQLAQNEQNTRDFMRGAAGVDVWSVWGQLGKNSAGSGTSGSGNSGGGDSIGHATVRESQPFMPGVDRWLEKVPFKVFLLLGLTGAICAYGYSVSAGNSTSDCLLNAGAGGFAGLIALHAFAKLFKVAIGTLMLAAAGYAIYYFGFAH